MIQQIALELDEYIWSSWKYMRIAFICAPCGFGKTSFARRMLDATNTTTLWLSGSEADLKERIDDIDLDAYHAVAVDDLHDVDDRETIAAISTLVDRSPHTRFVFISRAPLPGWLTPFFARGELLLVTKDDLTFTKTDLAHLLVANDLPPLATTVDYLAEATRRYPFTAALAVQRLQTGAKCDEALRRQLKNDTMSYFSAEFTKRFNPKEQRALLLVSLFEEVNDNLLDALFAPEDAQTMRHVLFRDTNFLTPSDNGWTVLPGLRAFCAWEYAQRSHSDEIERSIERAIDYFETRDDFVSALKLCEREGHYERMVELLEAHSHLHPGMGSYLELEDYYRTLPKDIVRTSLSLMRIMSLLDSMAMDIDGSEYWYAELSRIAHDKSKDRAQRQQARAYMAYLDIALPHRRMDDIVSVFSNLARASVGHDTDLVPSATSGMPSVLNGGRDFSAWVPDDAKTIKAIGVFAERFMGSEGIGMTDVVLAESKFEKGEPVEPLLAKMSRVLPRIKRNGVLSTEFAAVGLLARIRVTQGDAKGAMKQLDNLRRSIGSGDSYMEKRVARNLDALRCRIWLRQDARSYTQEWLEDNAPDLSQPLFYLDRYVYVTAAKVYLAEARYHDALMLTGALMDFAEQRGQTLTPIHLYTIAALAHWNLDDDLWPNLFDKAIALCYRYHYVRTIALYGAVVLPLLSDAHSRETDSDRAAFINTLTKAARTQASYYPNFLMSAPDTVEALTDTEMQVLRLLCKNKSNNEICEILGVKLPTVKTHVSHILTKLGVNRRSQAAERARSLHLV
ncbi:LuxR C-terminal-related transcriptional regulator [Hugonella massiliensis]|uniref:LuxR C-terminal-related transcriptional regulator n=1 Tax=Hugonella massiliensis TaxID=1720315 RepID=UPI00073EB376|nr:LuxR C-terminal-related transcriptional regulator [Hugonella massiliensis]